MSPRVRTCVNADSSCSPNFTRRSTIASSLSATASAPLSHTILISYFWATRTDSHSVKEGTPEFQALCALVNAIESLANGQGTSVEESVSKAYYEAQAAFCRVLRQRDKPAAQKPDARWLITNFITLGCPLTHAEFLLVSSAHDLESRKEGREFSTSPPLRERLDPEVVARARRAGLPISGDAPRLFCFPFGTDCWQLHHAAPYAAVRWTNIYD
jgi:hypothetical protein